MNKSIVILVNKHGRLSMKKIFKGLNNNQTSLIIKSSLFDGFIIRDDKNNLKRKTKIKSLEPLNCNDKIVLRWGARYEVEHNQGSVIYNKAENTKLVNNKGECRKFLEEKGIPVPKTFLVNELQNAHENGLLKYPMIGRPEHHGQGRHFYICNSYDEIKNALNRGCSYFSYFYPKQRELGIHVASGKILAIVEKPKPADDKMQWNRAQNEEAFQVLPWRQYKNYFCRVALDAVKAVGIDYGRVDIMLDPLNADLPRAVVCEINTAPTLTSTNYVAERWIKYFNHLMSSEKRIEHWDYSVLEKASSLSWKDNQFNI